MAAWPAGLTLTVVLAASACMPGDRPPPAVDAATVFEFGTHKIQITVPAGWEAIDQGRQKRFRKGEREIVLQNLGAPAASPRDLDALVDWGLAAVGHDRRREVKSRRPATIDGREASDIETWNRLDHSNPQRIVFVVDAGDLLALHTPGMAFPESLSAFDALRHSLHFVSALR